MNFKKRKKIIVSATSDLVSDNRLHKVCTTLNNMGFEVLLIGRKLPASLPVENRIYKTRRFVMLFNKGPLFYACFNIRLFCFLLFRKSDILLSNDLDTLPGNFLVSQIKNVPLVYDSHEYFTEVPELVGRPGVKKVWEWIEGKILPKIKSAYTVCDSIAAIYREKYGTPFRVVRNLPVAGSFKPETDKNKNREKIILYQGAVNVGRGLEQAIQAMHFIENARLVIAGDGDIKTRLEELVSNKKLENKVEFTGRLPLEKLAQLTPKADLGLSIEEDMGLNYHYALPNKLFDYIQAHVPVLVTNLPEMTAIVNRYDIGATTMSLEPAYLAEKITDALNNPIKRKTWFEKLPLAAKDLIWENEEKTIMEIFSEYL